VLRVVLCVALAVALLAVAVPAVENAAEGRTASALRDDAAQLERAANALFTAENAAVGAGGARRQVTVRLPRPSWTSAGVDHVAIGGDFRYVLDGGRTVRVPLRAPIRASGEPIVLSDAGRHILVLSLVRDRTNGTLAVTVSRAGRPAPR